MTREYLPHEDSFDRLERILEKAGAQENLELEFFKKEKDAPPVVPEESIEATPAQTDKVVKETSRVRGGKKKDSSGGRRSSGRKKPAVNRDMDKFCSFPYRLSLKRRGLLKLAAQQKGMSMNACIDEAMDQYLGTFEKEIRKRYGDNEQSLQVLMDLFCLNN